MPQLLAKTHFHVFVEGENHKFEPGDVVPAKIAAEISNREGCLEEEGTQQIDYKTLPTQVLREIVMGRELDPAKTKRALIAQLEEDDNVRGG